MRVAGEESGWLGLAIIGENGRGATTRHVLILPLLLAFMLAP